MSSICLRDSSLLYSTAENVVGNSSKEKSLQQNFLSFGSVFGLFAKIIVWHSLFDTHTHKEYQRVSFNIILIYRSHTHTQGNKKSDAKQLLDERVNRKKIASNFPNSIISFIDSFIFFSSSSRQMIPETHGHSFIFVRWNAIVS